MKKSLPRNVVMTLVALFTIYSAKAQSDVEYNEVEVYKSDMTNWTFTKLSGTQNWQPISGDEYLEDWTPSEKEQTGCDTGIGVVFDDDNDTDAWAISPAITLENNQLYRVTIWVKAVSSGDPENWKLVMGTSNNVTQLSNGSTELDNVQGFSTNSAVKYAKEITPTSAGNYYFGLNCYSEAENYGMYATGFRVDKLVAADTETGVEEIMSDSAEVKYYDINGYEVSSPVKRGIYVKIQNGTAKKVVIE